MMAYQLPMAALTASTADHADKLTLSKINKLISNYSANVNTHSSCLTKLWAMIWSAYIFYQLIAWLQYATLTCKHHELQYNPQPTLHPRSHTYKFIYTTHHILPDPHKLAHTVS